MTTTCITLAADVRRAISAHATMTGGSIDGDTLRAFGLTRHEVAYLADIGFLHRVRRDFFLVGHRSPSVSGDRRSKVMQAGDGACLSSLAAIDHWNFLPWKATTVDIVTSARCRPIDGARLRWSPALVERGATVHLGTSVLDPECALLSAAKDLSRSSIRRIIREGRYQRRLTIARLQRVATMSVHGVVRLREALALWLDGDGGHDSLLEIKVNAALPADVLNGSTGNARLLIGGAVIVPDRVWRGLMIAAEYNGPPHDEPDQRRLDELRRAALTAAGWTVVVIHWKAFERDPIAAVAPLVHAVRCARLAAPGFV